MNVLDRDAVKMPNTGTLLQTLIALFSYTLRDIFSTKKRNPAYFYHLVKNLGLSNRDQCPLWTHLEIFSLNP